MYQTSNCNHVYCLDWYKVDVTCVAIIHNENMVPPCTETVLIDETFAYKKHNSHSCIVSDPSYLSLYLNGGIVPSRM